MSATGIVLLVDGFLDELEMYSEFLEFAGFRVAISTDAAGALAIVRDQPVAAVVTRIRQRSRLDGIDLTQRIKKDPATRHVRVIVITTHVQAAVHSKALRAGCDRLLILPCPPDELAAELRRVLPGA